jgi:hypothetical protein
VAFESARSAIRPSSARQPMRTESLSQVGGHLPALPAWP